MITAAYWLAQSARGPPSSNSATETGHPPLGRSVSSSVPIKYSVVELVRNLMAHAQKPDFVFRLNGRVYLNRLGSLFSRLLAAEVCASALVMLDTLRPEAV